MPLILNGTGSGSVNKITMTAPTNGSTLTLADGKTVTLNSTLTFTGTDGTTFTFPSSTTNLVGNITFTANRLLASSGYQTLPGGIIIQWGSQAVAANSRTVYNFPIAFPSGCYGFAATGDWDGATGWAPNGGGVVSASQYFLFTVNDAGARTVWWMGIGY
jgi:hypothetical protein